MLLNPAQISTPSSSLCSLNMLDHPKLQLPYYSVTAQGLMGLEIDDFSYKDPKNLVQRIRNIVWHYLIVPAMVLPVLPIYIGIDILIGITVTVVSGFKEKSHLYAYTLFLITLIVRVGAFIAGRKSALSPINYLDKSYLDKGRGGLHPVLDLIKRGPVGFVEFKLKQLQKNDAALKESMSSSEWLCYQVACTPGKNSLYEAKQMIWDLKSGAKECLVERVLRCAADMQNEALIDLLLENSDSVVRALIMKQALFNRDKNLINQVLRHGFLINQDRIEGRLAVEILVERASLSYLYPPEVRRGSLELFSFLVKEKGAVCSEEIWLCVYRYKNVELGRCMFQNGMKEAINQKMYEAICRGDLARVEFFLKIGVLLNQIYRNNSLLMLAIERRKLGLVRYFLQNGADPNLTPPGRNSPLKTAFIFKDLYAAEFLIKAGANVGELLVKAISGKSPYGLDEIKFFIGAGADVNKEYSGHTFLEYAIREKFHSCIAFLLKERANVNYRFEAPTVRGGHTPLTWAVASNNIELVKLLLTRFDIQREMRSEARGFKGKTPLEIASSEGFDEIASLLRQRAPRYNSNSYSHEEFFSGFRGSFPRFGNQGIFGNQEAPALQFDWTKFPKVTPPGVPEIVSSAFATIYEGVKAKDAWKVFGLKKNSDKRDLTKAYRKLSVKIHPDKCSHLDSGKGPISQFATHLFRVTTELYDALSKTIS